MEPKVKFKGFEGEWSKVKLCSISKKVTTRNMDMKYTTTLTNSAEHGIIDQLAFFDHQVSNNNNISGYYVVENGDFVYNPRISALAPVGPINQSQIGYTGVMSPLYYVFRVDGVDTDYLSYYFKTTLWHQYLKDVGNSGARFDRLAITDGDFQEMPISLPTNREEQHAIASYFRTLDAKLQASAKKVESLKKLKSASLVAMFPQNGESMPKVRFKGFEGEWKETTLSECLDISYLQNSENKYDKNDVLSVSDDFGVMNQIELLGRSYAGKDVSSYSILQKGEIVYTKSPLKDKPFGIIKKNSYQTGIVSILYAVYHSKDNISADYIHYYFDPAWRLNAYMRPLVNKGAKNTMNISDEMALMGSLILPPSLAEQQAIATFFRSLDRKIALETARLEKLKQIKLACLDKMFV